MKKEDVAKIIKKAFTRHMVQHVQVPKDDPRDRVDMFVDEAADILENDSAALRWVPTSERYPDSSDGDTVLACYKDSSRGTVPYFLPKDNKNITHWMKLPEPPQENPPAPRALTKI
jgi:hypothetical protein